MPHGPLQRVVILHVCYSSRMLESGSLRRSRNSNPYHASNMRSPNIHPSGFHGDSQSATDASGDCHCHVYRRSQLNANQVPSVSAMARANAKARYMTSNDLVERPATMAVPRQDAAHAVINTSSILDVMTRITDLQRRITRFQKIIIALLILLIFMVGDLKH